MWFPFVCVMQITAGLRWLAGKERMRVRIAVPRDQAVEAVKEGRMAAWESS